MWCILLSGHATYHAKKRDRSVFILTPVLRVTFQNYHSTFRKSSWWMRGLVAGLSPKFASEYAWRHTHTHTGPIFNFTHSFTPKIPYGISTLQSSLGGYIVPRHCNQKLFAGVNLHTVDSWFRGPFSDLFIGYLGVTTGGKAVGAWCWALISI